GRPALVLCLAEQRPASEVCVRVLACREQGALLRQQAVLMRAGHHSDLLELELSRRQIPFMKYGGIRYLEAAHVKDFVALLRVAVNPADRLSWFRLFQLLDRVGPLGARRLVDQPVHAPLSLRLISERWPNADIPEAARPDGQRLLDALAGSEADSLPVRVERLNKALTPLIRAVYPDGDTRLVDLEQLV